MKDTAYKTFTKALIEVTEANPNKVDNSKKVIVRDTKGRVKTTFKNFEECLNIAQQLNSSIELVNANETATTYEVAINE